MTLAGLTEASCYALLRRVRWPHGVICPYCAAPRVGVHSRSPRTPRCRYACRSCHRTFTDLTAAPFARTNLPLSTWFRCLDLLDQGHGIAQLARVLRVKWNTTEHLQRRLRAALSRPGLARELRDALREARRA